MKNNTIQGFTLIELLVTITVMLVLIGGAMAGFIGFSDRREVQEAARQVQQLFVLAQQKASVREVPQSCLTNNFPLRAYRVSISNATPPVASLIAICVDNTVAAPFPGTQPASATYQTLQTYTLPNSVGVAPSNTFVDFYTLEGGANPARTYTFTGAASFSFSISAGGSISNVE